MIRSKELKLCPDLEYIGLKIERDQFIELANDSKYKSSFFKFNVEDVVLLYSINFEEVNKEIQVIQVNLNDATVRNNSIEKITALIQRNVKYQTIIVFVYKKYTNPEEFTPYYKIVVPQIHKGKKKDIYVIEQIAKTNLIF